MRYYIITGTSRGLGAAMAEQLLSKGNSLFCISRTANKLLIDKASRTGASLNYFEKNLYDSYELADLMRIIFSRINDDAEGIYLVNNAGMIEPIKPASKCIASDIVANVNVNLIAPMILSSEFIRSAKRFTCTKRILNISSGAARNPYYGWSSYCTSKSGLNMFTRNIALEEDAEEFPVKVVSMEPGIIDTAMQAEIRKADKDDFVLLDKFISFKKEGKLATAEETAGKILEYLHGDEYENGALLDIRSIMKSGME